MSKEKQEIKIRIPDEMQGGVFANNTMVAHSREEFVLDFLMTAPPTGRVVSRVIVTPGHLKRLIATLQDNLQKYERQHGPVTGGGDLPPMKMGFSG
jgi:hypothetical protein